MEPGGAPAEPDGGIAPTAFYGLWPKWPRVDAPSAAHLAPEVRWRAIPRPADRHPPTTGQAVVVVGSI